MSQGEQDAKTATSVRVPNDYRKTLGSKTPSKFADPCEAAAKESMQCLDRNNYKRDLCKEAFDAYRECKKIWLNQRREDRRAGRPSA